MQVPFSRIAYRNLEISTSFPSSQISLADAILALRLMAGLPPARQIINPRSDINNDGKISLAEAIYILQKVARVR